MAGRRQCRGTLPAVFGPSDRLTLAADLIDRAAPRPGERVLDVACSTGVVTRLTAERMGSGRVVGLDINAGMLAVARSLSPGAGPSIEWYEGSAIALPFEALAGC